MFLNNECLNKTQLLTQKILQREYATPVPRSLLQTCYGTHHILSMFGFSIFWCLLWLWIISLEIKNNNLNQLTSQIYEINEDITTCLGLLFWHVRCIYVFISFWIVYQIDIDTVPPLFFMHNSSIIYHDVDMFIVLYHSIKKIWKIQQHIRNNNFDLTKEIEMMVFIQQTIGICFVFLWNFR